MVKLLDKTVGVYHFLGDRVPRHVPVVEPKARSVNPWLTNGQAIVAKVTANEDIKATIERSIGLLGGLERAFRPGDKVMLKPNFNSPDPFPASTDLAFLRAAIEIFRDLGAKITIGECSGAIWRPTRKVFRDVRVDELARQFGVEVISFENRETDWVKIKIKGDYLNEVIVPRSAYEADKVVYLPCMKTHQVAGFSGAIKLAFGFVAPGQRRRFHISHIQEKITEVSLCWQPDIIIMDGRKAFVSGGPNKGQLVEPKLVLASGDFVAVDVEAMKTILSYEARNNLPKDPWQSPQVITALKHGLGPGSGGYVLVE